MLAAIAITILCHQQINSQKLVENKIDEFTKHAVKRTSWEILMEKFGTTIYIRFSKIDSIEVLDLKIMLGGKVFAVSDGETLMLKLSNDSIMKLNTVSYEVACIGCGARGLPGSAAYGVHVKYIIDETNHELLKKYKIKKVRLYTTDGYHEEEVTKKRESILQETIVLVE